jgi:hypothetical protein
LPFNGVLSIRTTLHLAVTAVQASRGLKSDMTGCIKPIISVRQYLCASRRRQVDKSPAALSLKHRSIVLAHDQFEFN